MLLNQLCKATSDGSFECVWFGLSREFEDSMLLQLERLGESKLFARLLETSPSYQNAASVASFDQLVTILKQVLDTGRQIVQTVRDGTIHCDRMRIHVPKAECRRDRCGIENLG